MNWVKRFEQNKLGRDLIVGDVHGHFTKLQEALDAIDFDAERDRLFSVGDLVDRGPESGDVLAWLARPWFHAVQGNHEDMAIDWADGIGDRAMYRANGGAWNMKSALGVQRDIAEAMRALPVAIELETAAGLVGIAHADCPLEHWGDFTQTLAGENDAHDMERLHVRSMALWNRQRINFGDRAGVRGVRAVVVGHTPVKEVCVLGNVYHIDTGGWLGRKFTILNAETLYPEIQRAKEAA